LSRFTLEEIALIAELEESEVKIFLQELTKENLLTVQDNNYIYNNVEKENKLKKRLPIKFQYQSQETIDMLIKCFCADISSPKVSLILSPSENCICEFNLFFRKKIYERQKQELLQHFKNNPQLPRLRKFFGKFFYFYLYNNFLYVSDELLEDKNSLNFSKNEIRQFKILYSWLNRKLNHNSAKYYTSFHIAEQIWRYNKEYNFLECDLKNLLF